MLTMLIKMTLVTTLYVLLTALVWKRTQAIRLKLKHKLLIGLLYGLCAVLSTHFGVDYQHMMLNVRDLGPLSAGLLLKHGPLGIGHAEFHQITGRHAHHPSGAYGLRAGP